MGSSRSGTAAVLALSVAAGWTGAAASVGCSGAASPAGAPGDDAGTPALDGASVDGSPGGDSAVSGGATGDGSATGETGDASPTDGARGDTGDGGSDGATPPPWDVIDLSGWSLDVPVDAQGQLSGTTNATIVNPIDASFPAFAVPYFHSVAGGGVRMLAPVNGATTTHSYYPRCELAETAYSKAHGGNDWPLTLGGTLDVTMSVDAVPSIGGGTSNGDVVIGQIKGTSTELCKIRYTGGTQAIGGKDYAIYVEYNNATVSGSFGLVPTSSRIPLGAELSYRIVLANDAYTVSIAYGGATFEGSSGTLDPSWNTDTYYFKAGVYAQANSAGQGGDTKGTGAGQVTLHALAASHPASPSDSGAD